MPNLLLIDDDSDFSKRLCRGLGSDYQVTPLQEADGPALDRLAAGEFALVLLDNGLPKVSGIEFLEHLEQRGVSVPVILVSGEGDRDIIIAAKKRGAFAYVQKQNTVDELLKELKPLICKALDIWSHQPRVALPAAAGGEGPAGAAGAVGALAGPQLVGNCRAMQAVYQQIGQFALIRQPVLILGEPGTGKDLVARAIHDHGPFVVVRCNAFDDDLLREELFGQEVGFRGEGKLRKGKIEYASEGTLYLDEVGELPLALQDEVLRVIEEQQVTRLGGNEPVPVDVRLLASSRRNLHGIPESKFRRELLDHLTGQTIYLPPLRERLDDLEPLANHLLARESALARKRRAPVLQASCQSRLRSHSWPGNVRELQLVLRRAMLHGRGPMILPGDLTFEEPSAKAQIIAGLHLAITAALGSGETHLFSKLRELLKAELVKLTMQECNDNTQEAEKRLGVSLRDPENSEAKAAPDPDASLPKDVIRRIKGLVLIQTYPEWTVQQFADKLSCSPETLYRDKLLNHALKLRKADPRLPHGYKTRDGSVEAIDDSCSENEGKMRS